MKELKDIKNILIIGSGTLGLRIALANALNGYKVTIYDIREEAFEQAKRIQGDLIKMLIKAGTISENDSEKALQNQSFTTDAKLAASDTDLVSESVTEDLELKKKVWAQFGKLCPEKTIFTTNTSSLLPSKYAEATGRPERFCALHFHDVFYANVVDIMPNPQTEPWIIDLLKAYGESIQQTVVIMKRESPGYIFNAMLISVLGAAGALVTFDVASIEDVDRSWMGNFKMLSGPFGILDEIGLDTAWHIVHVFKDEKSKRFSKLLDSYIQQGKLGRKVGEGFYKYPKPRFNDEDFIKG
ncbi:MAG: 3-hydroxyacyl-CoA dehydrogenase [Flavobacteriaceae bacterium]|nr:3-hydroxyacyl-CoA dehydrogenase [Flavobacteriaceae bacterium]